jgi:tetratricopeptide (TPR) repeat protein
MFASMRRTFAAACCCLVTAVQAQTLADPQWEALLDAQRFAELEKLAQARLQGHPDDPQATLAVALSAMESGEPARVSAALQLADKCLQRQPNATVCHLAQGHLLGVQALSGGMMKAMSLAGRIRDAYARAVELDPLNFDAREGLLQFYLLAPGIAGGSVAKAKELAAAAQARQPQHARLLQARVALQQEQWVVAERELAAVQPGEDGALRRSLREGWTALGLNQMREKQPAKAKAVFERLQHDFPAHAIGPYGLARVLAESGADDEAIALLERARALQGAEQLPIDYRLALAWLHKGDKARAKPLLERFVAQGRGHPNNLDDAKKRLAELG